MAKCHEAGIHVSAYLSLTNMFIDDMNRHVPASKNWMQLEAGGTPRPYGAAKYTELPWTSGSDGTSVHVPPLDLFAVLEVE